MSTVNEVTDATFDEVVLKSDKPVLVDYWAETVRAVGAGRVVLIHWDDFFRPLHKPLRALPYAVDDLDVSMRVLARLADEDSIALHLPTLWQRADPWISVS